MAQPGPSKASDASDPSATEGPGIPVAERLRNEIERAGYYPGLVLDSLSTAVGDEPVREFLVHHEATFDRDELRRHATVLVLTPTRLVMQHTDEHPADEMYPAPYASSVAEGVRLAMVDAVVITRIVTEPANYRPGSVPSEVMLTIGWGAVKRLDLEPATCGDPACEADHGYTGSIATDDLSMRFSAAADGVESVASALRFAKLLSGATSGGSGSHG